jgi:hypothetical protein
LDLELLMLLQLHQLDRLHQFHLADRLHQFRLEFPEHLECLEDLSRRLVQLIL